MTTRETCSLGSSGAEDWRCTTLVKLTQHLERVEYPATRAALGEVSKRVTNGAEIVRDAVARLGAVFAAHATACADGVFPRICAWERARCGAGPWPASEMGGLRGRLVAAGTRATTLRLALEDVRRIEGAARDEAQGPAVRQAIYALEAQLERQLDLEALLFTRAASLEPQP